MIIASRKASGAAAMPAKLDRARPSTGATNPWFMPDPHGLGCPARVPEDETGTMGRRDELVSLNVLTEVGGRGREPSPNRQGPFPRSQPSPTSAILPKRRGRPIWHSPISNYLLQNC